MHFPLPFSFPEIPRDHKFLANALNTFSPFAINALTSQQKPIIVIAPSSSLALQLQRSLNALSPIPVALFPDWETLPYDHFSPHQAIISARLKTLFNLQQGKSGIYIFPINTFLQRLCPPNFLAQNVLWVKKGDPLSLEKFREKLIQAGYRSVEQVLSHGEFASRGALLDLFPMGCDKPFRLDFFDDEIDSIRTFDVDNQRSLEEIDSIQLLPAHEFPTNEQGIEQFRNNFRQTFPAIRRDDEHIYQQVSNGVLCAGIEYWQPLFFRENSLATVFDYFPTNSLIVDWSNNEEKAQGFLSDARERFENRKVDPMRPLLPPSELWLTIEEMFSGFKAFPRLTLEEDKAPRQSTKRKNLPLEILPNLAINAKNKNPLQDLQAFIDAFKGKIIFAVETAGRRETLLELLKPLNLSLHYIENLTDLHAFNLWVTPVNGGFIWQGEEKIALITERELLGERVQQRQKKSQALNPDTLIRNLAELNIGQPVVHLDHGVGRYQGLTFIENNGIKAEFLVLEYANNAKLYVPVANLHFISRYVGGNDESAPLHKLGSDHWTKARAKALEKISDVAAELLDVYAQREIKKGFAFAYDRNLCQQFAASFPFEETEDQLNAINAVISDMCQPKAMDRLVCGDVGFGKTEVAIRAAFLAVLNQKQVAMLVPTTLLAKQHFDTLQDRFADQGVNVAMLSSFNSSKQSKQILEDLEKGKVDILVGTHKLLQNNVKFKDLGLLIIDEEHRFGVQQKEKIKALRANVDILTLTATPIPRTLNMAMNGIRDLSIIATPPAKRLTVKTFVRQKEDLIIREAVLREISRGGQVYYLHNDVASIENCAEYLEKLIPEARIQFGHGQMHKRQLERVMTDFHHQRFNVLVCSTIVETGIDIPSANTIIIERADKFGLAQLHQLRGRVGRSHHQAYAYLLTPSPKLMSTDAQKRLEALESLDTLGAGFLLATQDLEIRGAGELLGSEQSGQIESLGFSLYMDLLEQAVKSLQAGKNPSLQDLTQSQAEIDLQLPSLLPETYIGDVNLRLSFYKRIASSENKQELEQLKIELIDRFGLLPEPSKNLFTLSELRLRLKPFGVKRLQANDKGGFIEFFDNAELDPMAFLKLIQKDPVSFRFEGQTKFKFVAELEENEKRLTFVKTLIEKLF